MSPFSTYSTSCRPTRFERDRHAAVAIGLVRRLHGVLDHALERRLAVALPRSRRVDDEQFVHIARLEHFRRCARSCRNRSASTLPRSACASRATARPPAGSGRRSDRASRRPVSRARQDFPELRAVRQEARRRAAIRPEHGEAAGLVLERADPRSSIPARRSSIGLLTLGAQRATVGQGERSAPLHRARVGRARRACRCHDALAAARPSSVCTARARRARLRPDRPRACSRCVEPTMLAMHSDASRSSAGGERTNWPMPSPRVIPATRDASLGVASDAGKSITKSHTRARRDYTDLAYLSQYGDKFAALVFRSFVTRQLVRCRETSRADRVSL